MRRPANTLRETEPPYRVLFEQHPHPMWVVDGDTLRFLAVNDAAVAQYGFSRREFLSMSIEDLRPSTDGPSPAGAIELHRRKSGEVFEVESHANTIVFRRRRAQLVTAIDVSRRLHAERELKRLLDRSQGERPWSIRDELGETMHKNFGVFRREDQMLDQADIVSSLRERYERVVVDDKGDVFNTDLTQALELGFLLELADCMVVSGLARKESRGAHARPYDYPDRDDASYMKRTIVRWIADHAVLDWKPVTVTKWQPQERKY